MNQNNALSQYSTTNQHHFPPHEFGTSHFPPHQAFSYQIHNEVQDTHLSFVQPLIVDETKHYQESLDEDLETDDDNIQHDDKSNSNDPFEGTVKKVAKKTRGRVKIKMEFIQNKLRRYTTFSKRKTGIMKKAYELSTLTGTQVMLLVASETGHVYTFATRKLQPMITSESGKALIQTCLNSPDPTPVTALRVQQHPQVQLITSDNQLSTHVLDDTNDCLSQNEFQETELEYAPQNTKVTSDNNIDYPVQSTSSKGNTKQTYTTIMTPASSINTTVQYSQNQQTSQILSGQLQLHRIHPQNIILTGNSQILRNNVILNHSNQGSIVVKESPNHTQSSQPVSQVLTLINQTQSGNLQPVQWVYNNGVIYAPASQTNLKKEDIETETISIQHTPVIQTQTLQESNVVNRHILEDGTILLRK
ncbi:serum response factor homolog [Hydra vulgaris]|uniref:Serum response factor n=1 Tax=Hydra vulgaris TaxID=6087 RepID=Q964I0_HYDVU|nr:serum response factor homolog [Hydra vulgaris]AAK81817.1 serum response factor [Hydra vulgaris]